MLGYSITYLLHDSQQRLKRITIDLYEEENKLECNLLVKHIDDTYAVVQHMYPNLIGLINRAYHNVNYDVVDKSNVVSNAICNTSKTIIYFFKSYLSSAIDGGIGKYYLDIVEYCVEKVVCTWVILCDVKLKTIK